MDISKLSRDHIMRRVGRMEQLASIRRYVIDDGKGRGSRAFEVRNGSGLVFTVHPDKGLDIGPAEYKGLPIAWATPNGPVAPAFYDDQGAEWLRSWPGGLLTTCGFLNAGGPCETAEGHQGQHGRTDNIPAEEVNARCFWDGPRYVLEVTGTIAQTRVFGEKLVASRTIRTWLGAPEIEVSDRIENRGYQTMPLMVLYHMNMGWPLVDDCAELVAADHPVVPRDDYGEKALAEWNRINPPVANIPEQVFYHDLPADAEGMCSVAIRNPNLKVALEVSFRKRELPHFVHWKMNGAGEYVVGIEPANCYPEGQNAMAARGLLRHIEPGETVETLVRVRLSDLA